MLHIGHYRRFTIGLAIVVAMTGGKARAKLLALILQIPHLSASSHRVELEVRAQQTAPWIII